MDEIFVVAGEESQQRRGKWAFYIKKNEREFYLTAAEGGIIIAKPGLAKDKIYIWIKHSNTYTMTITKNMDTYIASVLSTGFN